MKPSTKLLRKLDDKRFPKMSGMMRGIVCCILGRTDGFQALCVTSDGSVLAQQFGHCGFNDFIGAASDLERNWKNLLDCAKLDDALRQEADLLYQITLGVVR